MAHSINFQPQRSKSFQGFEEFIFVGNDWEKTTQNAAQLHLTPDNGFLSSSKAGSYLLITKVCAAKNTARQLKNLQFKPGKQVQLINKTSNGSVVVSLDNKLIGIGSEVAARIMVTEAN